MTKTKTTNLSKYQTEILNWIKRGRGNAFVVARAGSGKTFTLVKVAESITRGSVGLVCFNKSIQTEANEKLAHTDAKALTIHSACFGAIRKHHRAVQVDGSKYVKAVREAFDQLMDSGRYGAKRFKDAVVEAVDEEWPLGDVVKLIDLCRLTLTKYNSEPALQRLADHYGMYFDENVWSFVTYIVPLIIDSGIAAAPYCIDFTDMVYLVATQKRYKPWQYTWLLVDEAQDLSKAQLEAVLRMVWERGRILFVGDPKQAIYGFAGSDHRSVDRIIKRCNCKQLPLSICYRCPRKHIAKAQDIVPDIEARPGAPEGILEDKTSDQLIEEVESGDLILCRLTAPLVTLCFELLAEGIPATIKGRDIGASLVTLAKKINGKNVQSLANFDKKSDLFLKKQLKRLDEEDEGRRQQLIDTIKAIEVIIERAEATTMKRLEREIQEIFSDDRGTICLSTVHRAKGLEADRVWIFKPDLMPFWAAKMPWQHEQEMNLLYVALTRAKQALFMVEA